MKTNIGVVGRFHAFDLAYQLQNKGILNKLITTYPKYIAKRWGIDRQKIVSELPLEIVNRYSSKIPFLKTYKIDNFIKQLHAKKCAQYLDECEIFIGWSSSSLETLIEAGKKAKIAVLERGSSHYAYQMNVMSEEYLKYGKKFMINYEAWMRELLEYELADYISIPSSYVKRTFIEHGVDEKKLLVNPYGVDLSYFKQIKKEDDKFRIIFAGGASLRKGFHYLMQAFSELNLPDSELWHLGSIDENIIPFIKRYQNKKIILKGHKPQNELYRYYSQGSLFILMSIEEGLAMTLIQAMACGLPIICTENTGGRDLVSKNNEEGYVIPIRDVDALKDKILYLYENKDICYEMGQNAKRKISNGFTWNDYGDRYFSNLKRAFNGH